MRIFGYFGKTFDYGSQFSFNSGNINEGSASSEGLVLKGLALIKDSLLTTSILTLPGRCFPSQTPGPWTARRSNHSILKESVLNIHWTDWCWSWNSNTLATWCEELSHWKRHWCWERLKAGGEGDDRGWDGWVASPTLWTWVWASSGSQWWTGRPGMLQSIGSQTQLSNWTELSFDKFRGKRWGGFQAKRKLSKRISIAKLRV